MKISYAKINKELNSERLRMALIPENIEAFWTPDLWVPLVKLENIYILPGIPELYQKMLNHNIDNILANKGIKFERCLIYTDLPEGDFSEELRNIAKSHPNVIFINLIHRLTLDLIQVLNQHPHTKYTYLLKVREVKNLMMLFQKLKNVFKEDLQKFQMKSSK